MIHSADRARTDGARPRPRRSTVSGPLLAETYHLADPRRAGSSVGDITPVEGVSPEMKHKLEQEAMHAFLNEMLGGEGCRDARERISSLWEVSCFFGFGLCMWRLAD